MWKTKVNGKDVFIGLLVAYIVLDCLLSYYSKCRRDMFSVLKDVLNNENIAVVVTIALACGFIGYYLSSRTREYFA
jgi:hypothetical protein